MRVSSSGQTLIEGSFDEHGRLDGEWVFTERRTGTVLSRSTMKHGTGTFDLLSGPSADVRLFKADCVGGLFDGAVESRQPRSYGRRAGAQ